MFIRKSCFILMVTGWLMLLAFLTIPRLNDAGLWVDEAWTAAFTHADSPVEVTTHLVHDRHPPLYFVSLWAWQQVAGDGEIALRLPSVFALLIGAALFFQWVRALVGRSAALISLVMLVLADKLLDFGVEARHYTWLMMWAVASNGLLVRWLGFRDGRFHAATAGRPGAAILYTLTIIAGLYTHLLMGLVILAQAGYVIAILLILQRDRFTSRLMQIVGLWALAGLAFLPWLPVFLYQYQTGGEFGHGIPMEWAFLRLIPAQYIGAPLVLSGWLLLMGIAAPRLQFDEQRFQWRQIMMPLPGILIPLLIMLGASITRDTTNILTERNLSLVIPPIALLIGLGIMSLRPKVRWLLVGILVINGLLTTHSHQYQVVNGSVEIAPSGVNPPWRAFSRMIAARSPADVPILMEAGSGGDDVILRYHVRQEIGQATPVISLPALQRTLAVDPMVFLRFEVLHNVPGFWYLYWSDNPVFIEALPGWGYQQTAAFQQTFLGNTIDLYRYDAITLLDQVRAVYGDRIRLHQFYAPATVAAGDDLMVGLWWSAARPLSEDYTVSVFLLNPAGQPVAQHDGYPQDNRTPTRTWSPDQLIYDSHAVPIPNDLPPGTYQIGVKLYHGGDVLMVNGADYAVLESVQVE